MYFQLHITVIDINDNRPEFNQSTYVRHISENAAPGTEVLVVTARDSDEDQRLFYTIHAYRDRESQGKFQINSETGSVLHGLVMGTLVTYLLHFLTSGFYPLWTPAL